MAFAGVTLAPTRRQSGDSLCKSSTSALSILPQRAAAANGGSISCCRCIKKKKKKKNQGKKQQVLEKAIYKKVMHFLA